jgi:hypothetical protein
LGRELSWYFLNHDREKFLMLAVPKFVYTYGADISAFQYDDIGRGIDSRVSAGRWPARLAQSYYALAALGFILGLAALARRRREGGRDGKLPLGAWLAWPVALTVVYLVFFGGGRFHFPMMVFVALLAGEAVACTGRGAATPRSVHAITDSEGEIFANRRSPLESPPRNADK